MPRLFSMPRYTLQQFRLMGVVLAALFIVLSFFCTNSGTNQPLFAQSSITTKNIAQETYIIITADTIQILQEVQAVQVKPILWEGNLPAVLSWAQFFKLGPKPLSASRAMLRFGLLGVQQRTCKEVRLNLLPLGILAPPMSFF